MSTSDLDSGGLQPWTESDLDRLQALLDNIPAPLEPLDVSMLDGFLCGVLLQPHSVPRDQWWPYVLDTDGKPPQAQFNFQELRKLVERRHAELNQAIDQRIWFDPWIFELLDDGNATSGPALSTEAVYPWVAGFAAAAELFPDLMALDESQLTEPLALLYQHLDANDLEDADALLAEIETLEPPEDLSGAVEQLVRATLLLADISRPLAAEPKSAPQRPTPPRPRGKPRRH